MLKPRSKPEDGRDMSFSDRFHYSWNRVFERFKDAYSWFELRLFHRKWISWVLLAAAVATLGTLLATTSTSLVPQEDLGSITVNVQAAPGTNLEETSRITSEVEEIIKDIPQVELYSRTTGSDARRTTTTAAASFNLRLKNWDERTKKEDSEKAVMAEIYRRTSHISAAQIRLSTRPMIAGYGSGSGFELYVQDKKGGTIEDLLKYTRSFIDDLNKREEISRAYTSFDTKYPQFVVDVDAVLCKRNGVSPKSVLSVLAGYVGGVYASNINRFTKIYRVMIQASPEFRASPEAFNNIYVRSTTGEMSPVSQYIHLTRVYGSESLSRFNLFPSIAVYGESGNGHSSGEAIDAIRQTSRTSLPEGYGFEFGGMSREEADSGNTTIIVFAICLLFIFLIL
jgi:HAE1 family hydrophobic/amphiphilic exporter-1